MSYRVKGILKDATNENIAWEKRLHHAHHPASRCPLQAKTGMEHLKPQPFANIGRGNMFMLGLRSRAIPC